MPSPEIRLVRAVARRPALWGTALGATVRHLPRGWWRWRRGVGRAAPWLRFRLETAYGTAGRTPDPDDLVTWLRWYRRFPDP